MGLYCYRCSGCEHVFEARHPYKERLTRCPSCKKNALSKILDKPIKILLKNQNTSPQTGHVVTKNIEMAKEEIKQEQKNLQKRVKK
jgi:putative FmdB family regulatory protein